jgi:nucleotide-binding universal stress UspA family protein
MTAHTIHAWHCPPKAVVAAVDFGEASARAVAVAGSVASAFGATLRVVHAERFEPPPYFTHTQIARLEEERGDAAAAAAAELRRFARAHTAHPFDAAVMDEPPVDAILHAADEADLVVLGTHGRRGPTRWWLGSVAERVVRAARVPVLVTRAGGGPVSEVFVRVVLVTDGVAPATDARACAERLASAYQGHFVDAGPVARCGSEEIDKASLVVVASSRGRLAWGIPDAIASALERCERPVLFLPGHEGEGDRP